MGFGFSFVPRPLPDFILQPWRKIGRWPGTNTTSRTENGGPNSYIMWTRFHNDGNVPHAIRDQYSKQSNSEVCLGVLPTGTDFASTKSLTKDV